VQRKKNSIEESEEINENEMMGWVEVEDSLLGDGINW